MMAKKKDAPQALHSQPPMVFLLGPPGAGKSTLGSLASEALGLSFLDLSDGFPEHPTEEDITAHLSTLEALIAGRAADVVELPWALQQEQEVRALIQGSGGIPFILWAHPEDMQARSGREERLFTPGARTKTRGGFGRTGHGCREFRSVYRSYGSVISMVNQSLEEAAEVVKDCIADARESQPDTPAERMGIERWVDYWVKDYCCEQHVAEVIVDAMARYLEHLHREGNSRRVLSAITSDLNAAGGIAIAYDVPYHHGDVLGCFKSPPSPTIFRRKYSDSANHYDRYITNLNDFAEFLKHRPDKK